MTRMFLNQYSVEKEDELEEKEGQSGLIKSEFYKLNL